MVRHEAGTRGRRARWYLHSVAAEPVEITVTLPASDVRLLEAIAGLEGSTVEAVAVCVLHEQLVGSDGDVTELEKRFDATPGFYERFLESVEQIKRGETVPASELRER